MPNLTDIINLRRAPGIMILDREGALLYMNDAVSDVVQLVGSPPQPGADWAAPMVPDEVRSVCRQIDAAGGEAPATTKLFYCALGKPYALRAFPVSGVDAAAPRHIMVLVEPVSEKRQIDFDAVQREYGLSRRELEVLRLICQGLSNREIGERLFISEHTVKDHVKKVLLAFDAASRAEVIAALGR